MGSRVPRVDPAGPDPHRLFVFTSARSLVPYLRQQRLARGWSQRRLARECGVPQSMIAGYESGASSPSERNLSRWATALDVEFVARRRSGSRPPAGVPVEDEEE